VRARHDGKIDGVAAGVCAQRSVPLVVSEAVLDANDDPARSAGTSGERETNQRLVKTTPKPRATKKSSGELLELPGPALACVAVAEGLPVWAVAFAGSVADGEGDGIVEFMIDGERGELGGRQTYRMPCRVQRRMAPQEWRSPKSNRRRL
jgi:hypothetical protein